MHSLGVAHPNTSPTSWYSFILQLPLIIVIDIIVTTLSGPTGVNVAITDYKSSVSFMTLVPGAAKIYGKYDSLKLVFAIAIASGLSIPGISSATFKLLDARERWGQLKQALEADLVRRPQFNAIDKQLIQLLGPQITSLVTPTRFLSPPAPQRL